MQLQHFCDSSRGANSLGLRMVNKEEIIRLLKNISCKNCRHLHLKLRWKFDPPDQEEVFCGKNVIRAHEGIEELPEKRYCNYWGPIPTYGRVIW